MDQTDDRFLDYNKLLEEKLDYCIHNIEAQLDKLFLDKAQPDEASRSKNSASKTVTPYSHYSYLHFKSPYIRDFRNFSGPSNEDVDQIRELAGSDNIDTLKSKTWTKESLSQLNDAVLSNYSQIYIVGLIKQKNNLNAQYKKAPPELAADIEQKLSLIDEQIEQVKARKEPRIFVPDDRFDQNIDWCAISAKLTSTNHDARDCRLMWSNKLHWTIDNDSWSAEEDSCLLNAVHKCGKNDWDNVAKEMNCQRLPWQCCARYQQNLHGTIVSLNEEDCERIIEVINLCRIGNYVPWNQVMHFIQYYSLLQVKYQWNKYLSSQKSSQPWSHHEDILLLKTIERFGEKDWSRVSNYVPGRTNKSCRERYTMRLKYNKRAVGHWLPKEDDYLLLLINMYGTNWSHIATRFPERNGHQIRGRYHLLKKNAKRVGPIKHRKLHRITDGSLVSLMGRRPKPSSDKEVDDKLHEIFTTYENVKSSAKSLVCRSAQDELIYQTLVDIVRCGLYNRDSKKTLLRKVIERALAKRVSSNSDLFPPCHSTIRGYKAWLVQQDYLCQHNETSDNFETTASTSEYQQILKVAMSLFLWPALLTKINCPDIEAGFFQTGSIIERDAKNLYKVREIQKQIASSS